MSNYPNMSYCMCENTLHAMRQILEAYEDNPDFVADLSNSERRAFQKLYHAASEFMVIADGGC